MPSSSVPHPGVGIIIVTAQQTVVVFIYSLMEEKAVSVQTISCLDTDAMTHIVMVQKLFEGLTEKK